MPATFFQFEPLVEHPAHERLAIGEDIKAVQFRWPLGMPLVKNPSDASPGN